MLHFASMLSVSGDRVTRKANRECKTQVASVCRVDQIAAAASFNVTAKIPITIRLIPLTSDSVSSTRRYISSASTVSTSSSWSILVCIIFALCLSFTMSARTVWASPAVTAPLNACDSSLRRVMVTSSDEFTAALASTRPGDAILLSAGRYSGRFVATVSGTSTLPIAICSVTPHTAILDGGGIKVGYGLHLNKVEYYLVDGLTVTNSQKGVMLDGSSHCLLNNLDVNNIGMEAVHFRTNSQYNRIQASTITMTGQYKADYGEGVYIGSSKSNLIGDASDYNEVVSNTIGPGVKAECIDIKEYSSFGLIEGNTFDGSDISGANSADSWVDVKGNNYLLRNNVGKNTLLDGFQTHVLVSGWGNNNVFQGNTMDVNAAGYGIAIQSSSSGNKVMCDNKVTRAGKGLANVACEGGAAPPAPAPTLAPVTTTKAPVTTQAPATTTRAPSTTTITNAPSLATTTAKPVTTTRNPATTTAPNSATLSPASAPAATSVSPSTGTFSWISKSWGSCSQACGGGRQTRSVNCQRTVNGVASNVSNKLCSNTQAPVSWQPCNIQSC